MKIVYFGSDDFGLPALEALARSSHQLAGVVSQPDRPAGRGRRLSPTPVSLWARAQGLAEICPERINQPEWLDALTRWGGDIGVVIGFGQKIGDAILGLFTHGCINLHSSLLPAYRGAAPVARAIMSGETHSGLTVFRLVGKMDAGPVVYQRATAIEPTETAGELRQRLGLMGPEAVLKSLELIEIGRAEFVPQDEAAASSAPKLSKAEGFIDFNQPATAIANLIRGLYPWPGVHALFVNQSGTRATRTEELVLARAVAVQEPTPAEWQRGLEVGTVLPNLSITAGLGAVRLLEVKPAGGRLMSFADFVNGRRVKPGDRFVARPISSLPEGIH